MSIPETTFQYAEPENNPETLVDVLDQVLDVGIVAKGDLTISVADVDLLYVGLKLIICNPDKLETLRPSDIGQFECEVMQ